MSNKKIKYLTQSEVRRLDIKVLFDSKEQSEHRKITDGELVNFGMRPPQLGFRTEKLKKKDSEIHDLKLGKRLYRQSLVNKPRYILKRDALVNQILSSNTPRWGGVKIALSN